MKPIFNIQRKNSDFKCPLCQQMVDVSLAVAVTTETDTAIYHMWDYGHQHKKFLEVKSVTDASGDQVNVITHTGTQY
jgi:gamma-glutamyl phosphate reductase